MLQIFSVSPPALSFRILIQLYPASAAVISKLYTVRSVEVMSFLRVPESAPFIVPPLLSEQPIQAGSVTAPENASSKLRVGYWVISSTWAIKEEYFHKSRWSALKVRRFCRMVASTELPPLLQTQNFFLPPNKFLLLSSKSIKLTPHSSS